MDVIVASILEKDAPNLLLSLADSFFHQFTVFYFMRKLLPNRLNIFALSVLALVYSLWFNLATPAFFGTTYHFWMNIFVNSLTWFVIIFQFHGKVWSKVMTYWYFDMLKTMCQTASYVPIMLYRMNLGFDGGWSEIRASVSSDYVQKLVCLSVLIFMFLFLGHMSLKIWRGLLLQKFQPFYLLFLILPFGQKYSFARVFIPGMGDVIFGVMINFIGDVGTIYQMLALFGIFACIVADIAIVFFIYSHDKKAAAEAELQEAKRVMELAQAEYDEVEKQGDELAKIRHDFNNQLMGVIQLVAVGENTAAEEIIDALSGEINRNTTRSTNE